MYSFLRRPAWIVSHILIAALIASLIGLGFWQRARYHEEREKKELLEERATGTPQDFDAVVPAGAGFDDVDESARYRRVQLTGTYDVEHEVAILNRSQAGAPGAWVMTPLILDDGTAVGVVRGWIRYDASGQQDPPFPDSLPPDGRVTVTGNVQLTQRRGSFGATDPADGQLGSLARVDLERYAQQLDVDLAPAWVLLDGQTPPQQGDLPQLVQLQTQDPSQNFSYMVQWWIFATIALLGYPLVLRAVARSRSRSDQVPVEPGPEPIAADPERSASDVTVPRS